MMKEQARSSAGIMGTRQPHDLGSRACFASSRANRTPGQQPHNTPLCRGPGSGGTYDQDGNAVEILDTLAAQPAGYNFLRD